jgi:hypothetical protein
MLTRVEAAQEPLPWYVEKCMQDGVYVDRAYIGRKLWTKTRSTASISRLRKQPGEPNKRRHNRSKMLLRGAKKERLQEQFYNDMVGFARRPTLWTLSLGSKRHLKLDEAILRVAYGRPHANVDVDHYWSCVTIYTIEHTYDVVCATETDAETLYLGLFVFCPGAFGHSSRRALYARRGRGKLAAARGLRAAFGSDAKKAKTAAAKLYKLEVARSGPPKKKPDKSSKLPPDEDSDLISESD